MAAILLATHSTIFFFNEKRYFDQNFSNFVSKGPNNKHIIGPDNGLAPNRRQAIIRNTDGLVDRSI